VIATLPREQEVVVDGECEIQGGEATCNDLALCLCQLTVDPENLYDCLYMSLMPRALINLSDVCHSEENLQAVLESPEWQMSMEGSHFQFQGITPGCAEMEATRSALTLPIEICQGDEPADPIFIEDAVVEEEGQLILDLRYSGGCGPHQIGLCWEGSFLESNPVQAQLRLSHDSRGDACEAEVQEQRRFDLRSMRDSWRAQYPGGNGIILLNWTSPEDGPVLRYQF